MKIAILIKTAPERISLQWLLCSIENSLSEVNYRIYIADEEPIDPWKFNLYEKLRNDGHFVKIWSNPVNVTVARNYLVEKLEDEAYVLRVDDDFEFGGEFNINALVDILAEDSEISFCSDVERQIGTGKGVKSGRTRIAAGKITKKNGDSGSSPKITLWPDFLWKYERTTEGIRYAKAGFVRNLLLIRRECFLEVGWDSHIKFAGEHVDFFLSLHKKGYQGAFTPDSIHLHRDDLKGMKIDSHIDEEKRKGEREKIVLDVFNKKWGGDPVKSRLLVPYCFVRLKGFFRLLKRVFW